MEPIIKAPALMFLIFLALAVYRCILQGGFLVGQKMADEEMATVIICSKKICGQVGFAKNTNVVLMYSFVHHILNVN